MSFIRALAQRRLEPEWLDVLPAADPRACRSRRDLRRVNFLMGHRGILRRCLRDALVDNAPRRIVELGAGDGTLMLALARDLAAQWPGVSVQFIDQQDLVQGDTRASFRQLGWQVECVSADLLSWMRQRRDPRPDVILANLVLHHFGETALRDLLSEVAAATDMFIAVEPRRSALALAGGRALGLIGCNDVTRHDAVVSVQAGFRDGDLSRLWPREGEWRLAESTAGLFSHLFVAQRLSEPARAQ